MTNLVTVLILSNEEMPRYMKELIRALQHYDDLIITQLIH